MRGAAPGLAAAGFALAVAAVGCDPFGVDTEHFVIRVDSVAAPDSIGPTDTLTARFQGPIGSDLCSRLDRIERHRAAGSLELRFHGVREEGGDCPQQPAALDHAEAVVPPLEDPFTIRVLQPSGAPFEKVVRVR